MPVYCTVAKACIYFYSLAHTQKVAPLTRCGQLFLLVGMACVLPCCKLSKPKPPTSPNVHQHHSWALPANTWLRSLCYRQVRQELCPKTWPQWASVGQSAPPQATQPPKKRTYRWCQSEFDIDITTYLTIYGPFTWHDPPVLSPAKTRFTLLTLVPPRGTVPSLQLFVNLGGGVWPKITISVRFFKTRLSTNEFYVRIRVMYGKE